MNQELNFIKKTMPDTRLADYYLGCLNGSVVIDFNRSDDGFISIIRISFDGYGCCEIDEKSRFLNQPDSKEFINIIEQENLNQEKITNLVKKIVDINKNHIGTEILKEYGLIE